MIPHRRVLAVLGCSLLAAAVAFLPLGCGGNPGKRIVILNNGNSPFWDACRAGMRDAEREFGLEKAGLHAVLEDNDATAKGQIDKLRQFATQSDIVGVAVSVMDKNNAPIADELRALRDKGVHVVTLDSDVDRAKFRDVRKAFIGTDNRAGGIELGRCARYLRPDGGGYVTFVGDTSAQNAVDRMEGLALGAGDKFRLLDCMPDATDRSKARLNVRNALTNHPDLRVLAGIWSYNGPAIADVVADSGRRSEFTVVVFDAEPGTIEAMAKGQLDAMVVQNPYQMGYQSVRLLKALVEDDKTGIHELLPNLGAADGDLVDTGLKVVIPDKGSPLEGKTFDKKTQVLTFSAFHHWLDEHNLTGS
jgi:ribose transport system substrate-binding protein